MTYHLLVAGRWFEVAAGKWAGPQCEEQHDERQGPAGKDPGQEGRDAVEHLVACLRGWLKVEGRGSSEPAHPKSGRHFR